MHVSLTSQVRRTLLVLTILLGLVSTGCSVASTPQPLAVSEGFAEIHGTRLYYKTMGTGAPIIFIHGGHGTSHRYFLPHLEGLAANHQLIFYDQRGSGLSDEKLDLSAISIDQFVADLEALRESLGFEKITIVGHSWGAVIGLFYAFTHQDRLDRLILASTRPLNNTFATDLAQTRAQRFQQLNPAEQQTFSTTCNRPNNQLSPEENATCSVLLARIDFFDPEKARALDTTAHKATAKNTETVSSLLTTSFNRLQPTIEATLPKIQIPTLIIHGDFDPIPIASSEYIQQHIPASQLVMLKESGHFPFVEQPDEFRATIQRFLDS